MPSDVFALTQLYDQVTARFTAENTGAASTFGWRDVASKLTTGQRVIWVPGDPGGDLGELGGARSPGVNQPRPIYLLPELFHVYIVGSDESDPENERKQYVATRWLYDAWLRAAYLAAFGRFIVQSSSWLPDRKTRRHGAAILVVATIEAVIPDVDATVVNAPADTKAEVDLSELDRTETLVVTPSP